MSPRSEEFMQQARDRLADAQAIIGTAHPAVIVSAAYYGMLYAARAALSERGEFAKTHSGTWALFSQVFVAPGEFDQRLSALARRAKDAREEGDYEASPPSAEEATEFVGGAADFITAIEQLLAA
ncbi:MAG: HEPN domain-containing protein [Solirubrobacterales bacterium]